MTLQLLTLARRGGGTDEIFDMNRVVASVADTLAMSTPSNIQVETELEEPIHPVMGQADLIFRVMDSLCQNAVDALGTDAGTITLSTANVRVSSDAHEDADIEYIRASVSDTGPGIPDDIKERIFEPFFTTHRNDDERRTGLGLNIAQNIIKDHSGYITVDASDQGTSVNIFIPIFPVGEEANTPVGKGECILIVDDDPLQISIMGRHLSSIGYQVISATSSAKALEYLEERPVDLMLLDIMMPDDLTGIELAARIRTKHPEARIIMVSGALDGDTTTAIKQIGIKRFISKPIIKEALYHVVRNELADRPG